MAIANSFENAYDVGFSPKLIITTIAVIILLVGATISLALWANKARQDQVISTYTEETSAFLSTSTEKVGDLFTKVFDVCDQLLLEEQMRRQLSSQQPYEKIATIPCQIAKEHLSLMKVEQLRDSSAIAYVKVGGGTYSFLTASGDFTKSDLSKNGYSFNLFSYSEDIRSDMMQYFESGEKIVLWQDFIPYIPGKEVIVPISFEDKIYGYIFRGVIER